MKTILSFLILLKINCAFFPLYFLQQILVFIYISNQNGGDEECSRVLTYFCSVASLLKYLKRKFKLILNFLLLLLLSVLFPRRSLLVQHQGRVKEALDNLSSFQTSISAGRRALQVRINCIQLMLQSQSAISSFTCMCGNFYDILFNKMKFSFR